MSEIKSKVLALKYRPQTFDDLIGHQVMCDTIKNSIRTSNIANAFLLTGIRGIGKTSTARIISKSINCKNGFENICKENYCENCEAISNSNSLDTIEYDAASQSGVDQIREILDFCRFPPSTSKYKIIILDECHMLSKSASNALLKTLEEPEKFLKFILCTTELRKVPITIVSRCQRFDLGRVKFQILFDYLKNITKKEGGNISDEALKLIIKISEGSCRDGLSLLDRALLTQKLEKKELDLNLAQKIFGHFNKSHLIELLNLVLQGKEKEAILAYRKISDQGIFPSIFLNDFCEIIYYLKNFKIFGKNEINFTLNDDESKELEKIANSLDNETLIMFWQFTLKSIEELNIVANQDLLVEMFLIRLIYLKQIPKLDDLLSDLENTKDIKSTVNIENSNFTSSIEDKTESNNTPKSLDQIKNVAQEKKEELSKLQPSLNNSFLNIQNFEELLSVCTKKRELKIKFDLEKNVRLIKFEKGLIEIESSNDFDKDFIKNLSHKLYKWTNYRWIITLSQSKGRLTKNQVETNKNKEILERVKKTEGYRKILENFPDAQLINIEEQD